MLKIHHFDSFIFINGGYLEPPDTYLYKICCNNFIQQSNMKNICILIQYHAMHHGLLETFQVGHECIYFSELF